MGVIMEKLVPPIIFAIGSVLAIFAWNDLQHMTIGFDRNYFPTLMFALWATVSAILGGIGFGLMFRR